jgi:hypothetical protein
VLNTTDTGAQPSPTKLVMVGSGTAMIVTSTVLLA